MPPFSIHVDVLVSMFWLYSLFNIAEYDQLGNWELARVDKHNGVRAGGPVSTRGFRPWRVFAAVEGFGSHSEAQAFEYLVKHPYGPKSHSSGRVERRVRVAEKLINLQPYGHLRVIYYVE